jgi:hypothetical protein
MNPNPDYSAAYAILRTDALDGLEGPCPGFTTGPGNDLQIRAIEGLADWVVGRRVEDILSDLGAFSKELVHEPHLRWLGPEKGVVHMARRCRHQRRLGPAGQARRAAVVAAPQPVGTRGIGVARGFPLPDGCPHA